MLGMRWVMRFIGLFSMIIVARLLTPDDFGLYAVASSMIGLMDAISDIGPDIAIIRHPNPQRQHYDTAWTLKIIMSAFAALLVVVFAYFSGYIYTDARYEAVLYVMALSLFLSGFGNIGIADFRRNLQFNKDFQFTVFVQVIGVATTIGAAYLLRSYWALVLGGLARSIIGVLLSFIMHSYRPRFSLAARQEMFGFSFWLMVRSLAMFLSGRGDRLVVGGFYSPTSIGWFAVAGDLAQMAVFELLHPIGRALLPGLAAKQEDKEWEKRNLKKIFNGTATIATAAGLGLAALAEPAITLVYGANFTAAASLLCILGFASAIDGFSQPVGQYLVVHGRTKELALLFALGGTVSVILVYVLASRGLDIQAVGYARLGVSFFSLIRVFYLLRSLQSMGFKDMMVAWIRPLLAGAAMYAALWYLQLGLGYHQVAGFFAEMGLQQYGIQISPNLHRVGMLAFGVPIGAMVFSSVLVSIWYIIGRPPGIEEEIMQRLFKRK